MDAPPPDPLLSRLRARFAAESILIDPGGPRAREPRLRTCAREGERLLRTLRDEPDFAMRRLADLTAIDRHASSASARFELVYSLHAPTTHERCCVHLTLDAHPRREADAQFEPSAEPASGEPPTVDSVVSLWPAANWLEREVFDLFGIRFRGHPDLRRILLEPDFSGAPLRKDYPRQPCLPVPGSDPARGDRTRT